MPVKSPDPQASILLFTWQVHWFSFVALALQLGVLAWYVTSTRRLRGRGRNWSPVRTACFVVGILVIAYATEGGIAHYEVSNFTAHIVQVFLLTNIAPPLLALGAPITLAVQSSSRNTANSLLKVLHSGWARAVTQPLVCFGLAAAMIFAYFLTPLYAISERHPVFLTFLHLLFALAVLELWVLIVGQDRLPRRLGFGMRIVLAFLLVPFNLVLGLAIADLGRPLYPAANTLADTQAGGNVLLGLAEVFAVLVIALLFVEWAREEERKAVRADRQLDAALAVARASAVRDELPQRGAADN
jgi:cytochrome c oxidase assembly factor CtaG